MTGIVLTDAFISIGGTTITGVKSITLDYKAAVQDRTAMGDTAMARIAGLLDWSVSFEFFQDHSTIDALLFNLVGAASAAIVIRPDSAAKSATNPEYTGSVVLESYSPLTGSVGDVSMSSPALSGDGPLSRAIA